jgi:hypothetical protein
MWVRIGENFVNLENVVRVSFLTGSGGQLHAHLQTVSQESEENLQARKPDLVGQEAEELRAVLARAVEHPARGE